MKKLLFLPILLVLILIGAVYFALNSSKFVTTYILPEISKRTGLTISADEVKLVGLKSILAKNLKVKDKNSFDFQTQLLKLNYSITQIFSKNLLLNTLELREPKIELIEGKKKTKDKKEKKSNWKAKIGAINIFSASFKNSDLSINNIDIKGSTKIDLAKDFYFADGGINLGSVNTEKLKKIGLKSNFELELKAKDYDVKKLHIKLLNQEKIEVLDLEAKGQSKNGKDIRLDLKSNKVELTKILALFGISTPELPQSEQEKNSSETEETTEKDLELPAFLKNKNLAANLDIHNIAYQDYKFKDLKAKLKVVENKLDINDLSLSAINTKLFANSSFDFNSQAFNGKISSKLVQLSDINKKFQISKKRNYSGEIKDLNFEFNGTGIKKENLNKNLSFSYYSKIKDIDFDKKFEFIIPFNLIFIPFKGLQSVSEKIPLSVLPKKMTGPFGEILETLANLDKLHCDKGEVKVSKEGESINLEIASFDMAGIVPNLKLPGTIKTNGDLKLNSKLEILKIWIPMPLTGTIGFPYPDLLVFGKELIKSATLSVVDL